MHCVKLFTTLLGLCSLTLTGACFYTNKQHQNPPVQLPKLLLHSDSPEATKNQWWLAFNQPQLNTWIKKALRNNPNMDQAWARLEQAQAAATQSQSYRWPQLGFDFNVSRNQTNFPGIGTHSYTRWQTSLSASYEIDVWGKYYQLAKTGQLGTSITRDDVEATAMTLTAQISETYMDITAHNQLVALIATQLHHDKVFLNIVEQRYTSGLAKSVDLYQSRAQIAKSLANLTLQQRNLALAQQQMAVLLGQTPDWQPISAWPTILPAIPPNTTPNLSANLLQQRPDLRAAHKSVMVADIQVGMAIADQLPQLRISANVGMAARSFTDLIDKLIWQVLGNLAQPIFQGGRLRAEVKRTRAIAKERVKQFAALLLQAMLDVQSSLIKVKKQQQYLGHMQTQQQHATAAYQSALSQYRAGLIDFLQVLNALQALHQVEQQVIVGQRQIHSYYIELYRALGGTWTQSLQPITTNATHKDAS